MSEPHRPDLSGADVAHFPAWVWQPGRVLRWRGFATSDIWITPGRVVTKARDYPLPMLHHPQIEYRWPTVVVETLTPNVFTPGLLVDINGQLGKVVVHGRDRLKRALVDAGFRLVEVKHMGWEAPHPVPSRLLEGHIHEVPECVIAP